MKLEDFDRLVRSGGLSDGLVIKGLWAVGELNGHYVVHYVVKLERRM